ncbi:unnamed protein product [Oreochromis niloticus]|nr:unnamed protein product [Mustela putorius furo]
MEADALLTRPTQVKQKASPKKRASLKSHTRTDSFDLPKGLIGTKSTAQVKVNGHTVSCLLDTGSQVTTVPESYYRQHLSSHEIKPLFELLEVEGANGQSVPYLGYIELHVTFPKEFLGIEAEVPTLALVVPDVRTASQSLVLIGTNTLDVLYELYSDACHELQLNLPYGYRAVLKVLESRHKQSKDSSLGLVTMHNKQPQLIPAGQTVVLDGAVAVSAGNGEKSVLLEYPRMSALPGDILVKPCLIDLPERAPYLVPVVLTNESEHDVTIPLNCVIGEVSAYQRVLSHEHSVRTPRARTEQKSNVTFNFDSSPLSAEWKERITEKLSQMPEVFAQNDLDFGKTGQVKHTIRLSDETPFKHRARPIHPNDLEAVRKHLKELQEAGVIRESTSPFSSPIVVVRKKNGEVRLCIDYRKLNVQTIKDAYALPNLEETFSTLIGSQWFSVLDLKSGYYQIEMEELDKPKTAFVCPIGFWEFNRMPQGITNAPNTFQRLMEKCMGDMNLREVIVFLDDIIVFSKTLEEHEARLMKVLDRLKEYGLKLSPEKCKFFQTSVRYLGHIVSSKGVETDPEKVEALSTWPVPRDLKQLRSFLGFSGYYRRFIKNYSSIVKPLTDLTSGYPPLRKSTKPKAKSVKYHDPKTPFGERWTPSCDLAFKTIIEKLSTAPVLGFADPKLPYTLHTDASTTGLGAALYQEQNGQTRVIAYASRGLSRSESRYPAHKLEFLALKWAVTEKFADYLYGNQFTVVTDSNPLTYILTTAKMDAMSYRWLAALSTFSFKLQYRAGKLNSDADGLSRRPHGELLNDAVSQKEFDRIQQFTQTHLSPPDSSLSPEVVSAICEKHLVCSSQNDTIPLVHSLAISAAAIPGDFVNENDCGGLPVIPHMSPEQITKEQRTDPCLREVIAQIETGEKVPPTVRAELPDINLLLRELNRLAMHNNILYRTRQDGGDVTYQLVLPEQLRDSVFQSLHCDMGHLGTERTLDLTRTRFYWPRMAAYIEHKIKTCNRCVRRKTPPEKAAPLVNIKSSRPLELVCMDFLSIEPDRSNVKDVLVLTDHFTKYSLAIPTSNQKAQTVAKALWDNFIVHYGIPERLHSDQGPDFESHLIQELCKIMGIRKIRTTPYHPRGNPVERFNRTLLGMLGTLEEKDKTQWHNYVKPLVHAYNCTKNDTTGFAPYELMFGRQPRLPVDLAFGLPFNNKSFKSHSRYITKLKATLQETYKLAADHANKIAERNKTRFDMRVKPSKLEPGDRVLVRAVRLRGKHKLADKWETDIHVVVNQAGDLPVYSIKPLTKEGPVRTVHRDLLLPCGFLAPVEEKPVQPTHVRKPKTRQSPKQHEECDHSELEDEDVCWFREEPIQEPIKVTRVYEIPQPKTHPNDHNIADTHLPGRDNLPGHDNLSGCDNLTGCDNLPECGNPLGCGSLEESETMVEHSNTDNESESDSNLPDGPTCDGPVEEDNSSDNQANSSQSNTESEAAAAVRRSERTRTQPERLQYSQLGNPLVSIAQSLFQGLSLAFTNALTEQDSVVIPINAGSPVITV